MLRALLAIFRPMKMIAEELHTLRQLYELDLASRQPPIYRLTEQPNKRDTEVSYAGIGDERPIHKRWFGAVDVEEEEE